jgi:hypothetical protein
VRKRRGRERKWEEGGGQSDPPTAFLSALEGIITVRKYFIKFDVDGNTVATCSIAGNEVSRVQQKV